MVQANWYQCQLAFDEKDKFELLRDIAEHNAMFMNAEGVRQVRDGRKNTFTMKDSDFDDFVKNQFGREMSSEEELSADEFIKKISRPTVSEYLDMDLDEIKFTPFK
jgi:hypothetical protein